MENIQQKVKSSVLELYALDIDVVVTRPDSQFGDGSTNVALQLASRLGKSPRDIANDIAIKLQATNEFSEVTIAGPGFLNVRFSDDTVARMLEAGVEISQVLSGKKIVAEYSDPNPFKVLHAGHLYTSIVGDAIANTLQSAGAEVHRVNFGGDVGLHVGKTMWALLQELGGEYPEKLSEIPEEKRSEWLASAYIRGTAAYEDDESAKADIVILNKRVYALHNEDDHSSPLAVIYWTCRQWSYDYFNVFYARIGTTFEKYYPESSVAGLGLQTVQEQLAKGIFTESNGAVVFDGESHGLHTRVFINSEGLPTYEAKDVGLLLQKKYDYDFDTSLVITGNEQEKYMSVVLKAVEQFAPELALATKHVTHGIVKLAGGVKMSSRKGNILRAVDVLDVAAEANQKARDSHDESVVLGAVKYAFLKQRIGSDIIYDPEESVSMIGNSGPYLQYAYARAFSILQKAKTPPRPMRVFNVHEKSLALKIAEFPDVMTKVLHEYMPHHICTYIYELTQEFNRFYENEVVIGSENEAERLGLVRTYTEVLQKALHLLGIQAPEKM